MQLIQKTFMYDKQLSPMEAMMLVSLFNQSICACGKQAEIIEINNKVYCHTCYLEQVVAASKTVTGFVTKAKETL